MVTDKGRNTSPNEAKQTGSIHTSHLSSNISSKLSHTKGSLSFTKTARPCL